MADTGFVPTVGDVMAVCRNYFEAGQAACRTWTVSGGRLLPADELKPGDWIAVGGACALSGVHRLDENGRVSGVPDGTYSAVVWRLAPPESFLRLCAVIAAWCGSHPHTTAVSEHFGDYSRTLATGAGGAPLTWPQVFCVELMPWRHMMTEVDLRA